MAGLSNTGIKGFIASAKFTGQKIIKRGKEIPEMVEHFLSALQAMDGRYGSGEVARLATQNS